MTKFREYVISDGESIQIIAQKALGDAGRGMELALLNNLDYPFISRVGSEEKAGIKRPGDTLLIPIEVDHEISMEEIEENILHQDFGNDLLLTTDKTRLSFNHGGELVSDMSGDLQTTTGVDTLTQDLTHRLITEEGTLHYHPEYGSKFLSIIGNRKDSTWKQKAILEVTKTFLTDPRVVNVTDVFVEYFPTGIALSCTIVTSVTKFIFETLIPDK